MPSSMPDVETALACRALPRTWDGVMVMGEFTALLMPELKLEPSEVGEISEIHSGGLVVLLVTAGLSGRACPGGLVVVDKGLRLGFDTLEDGSID